MKKVPKDLSCGDLVRFKCGLDWYRGIIVKLKADKVRLFSIDWGWTSKMIPVVPNYIQPLEKEMRRVKFWASACSLMEGEQEVEGNKEEGDKLKMTVVKVDKILYIVQKM